MNRKQALAVFTRTPQLGVTKTRLVPLLGEAGAMAAHSELARSTLTRLAAVDAAHTLWVTLESEDTRAWAEQFGYRHFEQRGADLGERMANVFADLFATGARRVCLVGTDCPTLDAAYVDDAFTALEGADVVLGPAEDGGYGLIALRWEDAASTARALQALFYGIPWSTAEVAATTVARAAGCGLSVTQLPRIWDVDRPADWRRYQAMLL